MGAAVFSGLRAGTARAASGGSGPGGTARATYEGPTGSDVPSALIRTEDADTEIELEG